RESQTGRRTRMIVQWCPLQRSTLETVIAFEVGGASARTLAQPSLGNAMRTRSTGARACHAARLTITTRWSGDDCVKAAAAPGRAASVPPRAQGVHAAAAQPPARGGRLTNSDHRTARYH